MIGDLVRDTRHALRGLRRSPSFTVAAVLALAIAIGANTAVFSVVYALLSFPLPIAEPDRVAFLFAESPAQGVEQGSVSADDYLDLQGELTSFSSLAAMTFGETNVVGAGEPQRVRALRVTPGFFAMTGVAPRAGRAFADEREDVAVVSHGFWRTSLGGGEALGTTLRLDGRPHEVVGVLPEDFSFLDPATAVYTPLVVERGTAARDRRDLLVLGRLAAGASAEEASAEAAAVAARLAAAHPDTNEGWTASVVTVPENFNRGVRLVLVLLYSAITFVLLIACVNVANLLLARALAREREIALRSSLGASRGRLVRQLLVESLTLALAGGGAGVLLGLVGTRVLRGWIAPDPNVGFIAELMRPSPGIVTHGLVVSAVAGILFGLAPALQLGRADLVAVLKEGGRVGESRRRRGLRAALVAAEVALALALLVTAGTVIRAFRSVYEADPGFVTSGLLVFELALSEDAASDPAGFFADVVSRVAAVPGAQGVAVTTVVPLADFPGPGNAHAELPGRESPRRERAPNVHEVVVGPSYLATLGIPLRRGRAFDARDRADGEPVAMVTEDFLARFDVAGDGLDVRVRLVAPGEEPGPWRRIVGVVAEHDSHAHSLRRPRPAPLVYLPLEQAPRRAMTVVVRAAVPPLELAAPARAAVASLDPTLPLVRLQTLEGRIREIDTQNTFFLRILSGLAATALVLAAVGIYGVVAYTVGQRRREIGVRAALGARPRHTVGLVMRQAAVLTVAGLVVGAGLATLLVRFMASQLERLATSGATGPATFATVGALLLTVALLACAVPTLRALRVDPAEALRVD